MKKLLIIDANSIINRAFYGVRALSAKDGTPTNAVYGFMNMLIKLLNDVKPDYLCAAFDLKAPTFRHKMYDGYKAQRKPMPDDLREQMPIAKEILNLMKIVILEKEGYEADDIIGTVSRICEENDVECMIATGDKDDLQLATDKTKVILTVTRSGLNETVVYDDKAVFEKYGVTPTEFIDVKALMGDPSDNIPGVAGVGEKTALSLISKFSNIEYIYENLEETGVKGAMLRKLTDGKDMAFLSKELSTIDINVPIEFDIEKCITNADDIVKDADGELYNTLSRLGLNSIIKRLDVKPVENNEAVDVPNPFENTKNITVTTNAEISEMVDTLSKADEFSCVFSFSGQSVCSCAFAIDKTAYYVAVNDNFDEIIKLIKPVLENEKIKKITCDIKDTLVKLSPYLRIKGIAYDVAISEYLIAPERSEYDIDTLCRDYLHTDIGDDQNGSSQISLFDEDDNDNDMEIMCRRALCILLLRDVTAQIIEKNEQHSLYYDVELPLVEVLADMQIYGFSIDKKQLSEFSSMIGERIDVITKEIYDLADEEFNVNSPKQLGVILFEKLGLKVIKKTKTGYSTNAEVLEKLLGQHPIIELIMEYRQLAKLKSTYCDGLSAVINPDTGKIHSVFNQTVTVTGRISSTEPNMQNIPIRTELGREIRKMFTASEGMVLVDADYSQIELRVLAHIANDTTMTNAFISEEDIHSVTASQVLDVPLSEVTPEQRSSAKAVNFGIVYGIGEFSLSQDLKISVSEAKRYINNYLEKYHGVREYMTDIKEKAKKDGYVKTLMNRIRYIPELKSSNYNIRSFGERVALNTPIQGTAADIIKLAMVRVYNRLNSEQLKARLILQVHDELIIECPKEEIDTVKSILKEEMENAMKLNVPLVVDMSEGASWYDAK